MSGASSSGRVGLVPANWLRWGGRGGRALVAELGASHVTVAEFVRGPGGGLSIEQLAIERHLTETGDEAAWISASVSALTTATRRCEKTTALTLAIPAHVAFVKCLKIPPVHRGKRQRVLEFEAAHNIPYPIEHVIWDHAIFAETETETSVVLAAAKSATIEQLLGELAAAGFRIEQVLPAGIATLRGFNYNHPESAGSVLIVDIGARSTQLVLVDGERFVLRTLALAGNTVTQRIADELQIDFPRAEVLKQAVLTSKRDSAASLPPSAAVASAVEQFATRLGFEIGRSCLSFERQMNVARPQRVLLTGGGAQIEALVERLAAALRIPVDRYNPVRRVTIADAIQKTGVRDALAVLSGLVGLAAERLIAGRYRPSLLPDETRRAIAFRRRQPMLMMAAVAGVAALVPPTVYFHRIAVSAERHAQEMATRLHPLQAIEQRNRQQLARLSETTRRIEALRGELAAKTWWARFFAEMQERLDAVEHAWLETLTLESDGAKKAEPRTETQLRARVSGVVLDVDAPTSKISAPAYARVRRLLESFRASPLIRSVEGERFDQSQPGRLRFEVTLTLAGVSGEERAR